MATYFIIAIVGAISRWRHISSSVVGAISRSRHISSSVIVPISEILRYKE